jgi:TatD DNase family protein
VGRSPRRDRGAAATGALSPARVEQGRLSVPAARLLDAHAHLTDARFTGDLEAVLERASAAGIERILVCGEDVASSELAIELARRHSCLRAAVGIHPHRAQTCDDAALERLSELARDPLVVAIGEIGVDLSGRSAPRPDQERVFAAQLALAKELEMPVCLHVREAGDVARRLVDRCGARLGYVHCYSEGAPEVVEWTARGFYLSFSGTVTYPKNGALRAAAAAVPADRLLLETDSPYLAPQGHRSRRNEPALVAETYASVAAARGQTVAELAETAWRNAAALFGKAWSEAREPK